MKVGIDSYCYHRFFGEVYPQQPKPSKKMTLEDFLKRAKELEVDGVSLESCFIPRFDGEYLAHIKEILDEYKLDRVFAWGHPDGLEGGKNQKMYEDMIKNIEYASKIGAKVMRVVGSSLMFRFEPVENHIDFNSDEILTIIKNVNSPYLGINFDSGNFVRVLDDPVQAMEKLAKYVYATHIKDLKVQEGVPVNEWYFFSCTPVGDGGIVNNQKLAQLLQDNNYQGFLAVEIDFLHPDYNYDEDSAVARSIKELKRIAREVEKKK